MAITRSKRSVVREGENKRAGKASRRGNGGENQGKVQGEMPNMNDNDLIKRIHHLLQNKAFFELAYPQDKKRPQTEDEDSRAAKGKSDNQERRDFFSGNLSAFEQLLCASILSKPLSHRLGLRTIATILNPPYELKSPSAVIESGFEGRRQAMYDARTQHKDKTAEQLGNIVAGLRHLCGVKGDDSSCDVKIQSLTPVCEAAREGKNAEEAAEKVRSCLTENLKGLGPGGVNIFLRRIQKEKGWSIVFPFMDQKSFEAAVNLGLVPPNCLGPREGAQYLADTLSSLQEPQEKFVRLLDIIVGLDLEKNIDKAKERLDSRD